MKHPRALIVCVLALCLSEVAAETYPGPYPASIARVIDGDTVEARARVWPGIEYSGPVRMTEINAPELHTSRSCERAAGEAARAYIEGRISSARSVKLSSVSLDKFGRALARVSLDGRDLGDDLIAAGHARAYDGGKREAWCI